MGWTTHRKLCGAVYSQSVAAATATELLTDWELLAASELAVASGSLAS
jgi:hypothetical protein